MKKFIMLSMLFCGSAYSMDDDNAAQIAPKPALTAFERKMLDLKRLEIAVYILSSPVVQNTSTVMLPVGSCPGCGSSNMRLVNTSNGSLKHCDDCKERFTAETIGASLKAKAIKTAAWLQDCLDSEDQE